MEAFLTLAEELHFGRTAERMRLSQARISQQIKALEQEIGTPLFERTSRRVSLTRIGAQLRDDLQPAYEGVQTALARASAAGRGITGELRVAFLGPVAGELLLEAAAAFRDRHPARDVELKETQIAEPLGPLREGAVDLVLTQLPVDEEGLVSGPTLIREPRVLAVSARHPYAQRDSVTLEDLASTRIPTPAGTPSRAWEESYQPWHTPSGAEIERGPAVGTFEELLTLIAAGRGECTVAAHNVHYHPRNEVSYIPIADAPAFDFGLVWRAAGETRIMRAFTQLAAELVERKGGPEAGARRTAS